MTTYLLAALVLGIVIGYNVGLNDKPDVVTWDIDGSMHVDEFVEKRYEDSEEYRSPVSTGAHIIER